MHQWDAMPVSVMGGDIQNGCFTVKTDPIVLTTLILKMKLTQVRSQYTL